jgi:hypothetical protein
MSDIRWQHDFLLVNDGKQVLWVVSQMLFHLGLDLPFENCVWTLDSVANFSMVNCNVKTSPPT